MGKYRGADGWLHDDSVGKPIRYENKDSTNSQETPQDPRISCPKCGSEIGLRLDEGYCNRCSLSEKSDFGLACCFSIAVYMTCSFVAMGVGHGIAGFGGLLAGLGIGLALPTGIFLLAAAGKQKDTDG